MATTSSVPSNVQHHRNPMMIPGSKLKLDGPNGFALFNVIPPRILTQPQPPGTGTRQQGASSPSGVDGRSGASSSTPTPVVANPTGSPRGFGRSSSSSPIPPNHGIRTPLGRGSSVLSPPAAPEPRHDDNAPLFEIEEDVLDETISEFGSSSRDHSCHSTTSLPGGHRSRGFDTGESPLGIPMNPSKLEDKTHRQHHRQQEGSPAKDRTNSRYSAGSPHSITPLKQKLPRYRSADELPVISSTSTSGCHTGMIRVRSGGFGAFSDTTEGGHPLTASTSSSRHDEYLFEMDE